MRQGGSNPRRSRGRGPRKPHNPNGPTRPQNFDSGGGEMRVRGNAYQVMEKYLAMARDASAAGDRIARAKGRTRAGTETWRPMAPMSPAWASLPRIPRPDLWA